MTGKITGEVEANGGYENGNGDSNDDGADGDTGDGDGDGDDDGNGNGIGNNHMMVMVMVGSRIAIVGKVGVQAASCIDPTSKCSIQASPVVSRL